MNNSQDSSNFFDKLKELIKLVPILEKHPLGSIRLLKFISMFIPFTILGLLSTTFYSSFSSGIKTETGKLCNNILFIILVVILFIFIFFILKLFIIKDFAHSKKEKVIVPPSTIKVNFPESQRFSFYLNR